MTKKFCLFLVALLVSSCSHQHPVRVTGTFPQLPKAPFKQGFQRSQYESRGTRYMVSSQGDNASRAGAKMFELNGNFIDAAVATSFVISVERPQSTGIGGGGFMLIHLAREKRTLAVDFREQAPASARENMFLDRAGNVVPKESIDSPLASGVPGLIAGLVEVHAKYGKLPLTTVMEPAIALARQGFRIYPELAESIQDRLSVLQKYPDSRRIFLREDGSPKNVGDLLVQSDLANTLAAIAKAGAVAFYRGNIADKIVAAQKKYGGLITAKDLAEYRVVWRQPVWGKYKEWTIASMPPPSSGGVHVIEILNILEPFDLAAAGPMSPRAIHLTASAMQRAFADRAVHLGDSDFVRVPVAGLISKRYAAEVRAKISDELASPSSVVSAGAPWPFNAPEESPQTTHLTVMDADGNTVSSTQTINTEFGNGMVADGTGIVMNNEMDDFSAKPGTANAFGAIGGKNNAIAPKKRPLSSMSPTIIFADTKPVLALGTPSGTRIISCVSQTILNYLEYKMPLFDAVSALRYHHQWSPDEIRVEAPGLPEPIVHKLRSMGHSVRERELGCKVNAIARESGGLLGVADPRAEGMSVGR